jgi:hypothetical protein
MGCMGCGKSSASKPNSYTPKKASKGTKAPSSPRGGYRSGNSGDFGSPKVKVSFGARGR